MKSDPQQAKPPAQWATAAWAMFAKLASQRTMNFAFADQVMVSGANFAAGILMARAFGMYEFGRFALAWLFVEFLGSLQSAAIIQPMLNIGPKQAEVDGEGYYHAIAAQQGAVCATLGILVWTGATLAGWLLSDPELHRLALPLCVAIVTYQLHNFFRRYFFARDRVFSAFGSDLLRYSVQISATAALAFAWPGATAVAGIWIIAAACAVSTIVGLFLFGRLRWNTVIFRNVLARHWEFSKWLLPSALMFWMTAQGFLVMSGFVLGAAATGGLRAAISIIGVMYILLLALDNFAPAQAARALHLGGPAELRRYIIRLACLTGGLMVGGATVLNVAPQYVVHLLYGDQYEGIDVLVQWLCLPAVVHGMSTVLVVWAAALERTRTIFISYAAATAFTIVGAYPLTRFGGVEGVVLGSLLVEIIRVISLLLPLVAWTSGTKVEKQLSGTPPAVHQNAALGIEPWSPRHSLYRLGLRLLSACGLPGLMARRNSGQGGVLCFHRVYVPAPHEFGSHSTSVTPDNFRLVVQTLIDRNYRFLTMSELAERLHDPQPPAGKFVCLTFDDGFVDTYTDAFAICREFGVPMTVYLVSGFLRREFAMWSFGLEQAIAANDAFEFNLEGEEFRLETRTMRQKRRAYFAIASRFVTAPPSTVGQVCSDLGKRYGIDFPALSDRNALTPAMIAEMQASGLVEFGGHSVHHAYLSSLDDGAARLEIAQGKRDCEALTGKPIRHFAYPYGDSRSYGPRETAICRELGFVTAVTTESSPICSSDRDRLLSLPRLTYNGYFQNTPLLDLLLSGTLSKVRHGWPARLMQALVRNSTPRARPGAANGGRGLLPGARPHEGKYSAAGL